MDKTVVKLVVHVVRQIWFYNIGTLTVPSFGLTENVCYEQRIQDILGYLKVIPFPNDLVIWLS